MSLATRCPVCQTVFRVVQDQLKVSEGWVRCGRCAKVFNAFEGLFDLEREFPALRSAAGGTGTPSQRVLEDLARRNPRPEHGAQWEREFDTRATVRDATPPSIAASQQPSAAPGRTPQKPPAASAPSAAAPFQHSAPAPFLPSAPPSFKPSAPAPFKPSAPAFQASAPAGFQASAPRSFRPSVPAPQHDSAAIKDDATVAPGS